MHKIGWRLSRCSVASPIEPPFQTREVNDMPIKVENKLVRNSINGPTIRVPSQFLRAHTLEFRGCLFIVSEKAESHRVEAGEKKGKGLSGNENSD